MKALPFIVIALLGIALFFAPMAYEAIVIPSEPVATTAPIPLTKSSQERLSKPKSVPDAPDDMNGTVEDENVPEELSPRELFDTIIDIAQKVAGVAMTFIGVFQAIRSFRKDPAKPRARKVKNDHR